MKFSDSKNILFRFYKSMRISPIHNITFKSNNEIKQSKPSDNEKGLNNSAKLALGVSGGAALGVAAYFLFRGNRLKK